MSDEHDSGTTRRIHFAQGWTETELGWKCQQCGFVAEDKEDVYYHGRGIVCAWRRAKQWVSSHV